MRANHPHPLSYRRLVLSTDCDCLVIALSRMLRRMTSNAETKLESNGLSLGGAALIVPGVPRPKKKRRVSFSNAPIVLATVEPSSSMSDSQRKSVWYSQSDMDTFKDEARLMCLKLRFLASQESPPDLAESDSSGDEQSGGNSPLSSYVEDDEDECSRGLEQRICCVRQQNRRAARRSILNAHRWLKARAASVETCVESEEQLSKQLAMFARKRTAWAIDFALEAGQLDSDHARAMCMDYNESVESSDSKRSPSPTSQLDVQSEIRSAKRTKLAAS